jgi:hypothetical protein
MAAVKAAYGFRIKPGRFDDWRALAREGEKLVERHGGRNLRNFAAAAAGPETPVCTSTIDFDDAAAWGAFQDATAPDTEVHSFNERLAGRPDSPAEILTVSLLTEIHLGVAAGTPGPLMEVYVSRVPPGRLDDAVAFAAETAPIALGNGPTAVHLYALGPAGSETGRLVWTAEFPSFTAYGRHLALLETPEIRRIMQRMTAPDSPLVPVFHGLYSQIPL